MPAVRVSITTAEYLAANFSWYEIYASQTNLALVDVVADAEFSDLGFARSFIHPNLTAADTWYYWVRAAYDRGAAYSALTALGSLTVEAAPTGSGGGSLTVNQTLDRLTFIFDGAGSPVAVGAEDFVYCPFDCVILGYVIFGDVNGDAEFDVQVDTLANYPPTGADSIVAAVPPTCTGADTASSSTLTGWDVTIAGDSFVRAEVTNLATMTKVRLVLIVAKV